MANNFESVGQAFAQHYYSLFDSDRKQLKPLYRENSMLSFEGSQFLGSDSIITKLSELPFQKVQHQIITCDCQPLTAVQPNGVLVSVSGNLVIDDGQNPMKFAQCFMLIPDATNPNSYWVHNDIFRLNLG